VPKWCALAVLPIMFTLSQRCRELFPKLNCFCWLTLQMEHGRRLSLLSPFGRDGRGSASEGEGVDLGEDEGEGLFFLSLLECEPDCSQHAVELLANLMIPESQNKDSMVGQEF
jgi:hypothetical protein